MKRVAAACILFLTAVAIIVWTDYVFEREMNMLEKELNAIVDISETIPENELLTRAENIAFQWEKSSGKLRSMVLHDGIDELGRSISSLPRIIEHSGKEEMKTACIEALSLIKNLKECEMVCFENIL